MCEYLYRHSRSRFGTENSKFLYLGRISVSRNNICMDVYRILRTYRSADLDRGEGGTRNRADCRFTEARYATRRCAPPETPPCNIQRGPKKGGKKNRRGLPSVKLAPLSITRRAIRRGCAMATPTMRDGVRRCASVRHVPSERCTL